MSGIYYIQKDNKNKFFYSVKSADRFILPNKIYGNIEKIGIRVWNTFAVSKQSTGILLTGNKGSGKTILGEIICNLAIDRRLPVYVITEIEVDLELIAYLRSLSHCVIFLDEFAKNVGSLMMDKMLTMFSDVTASCKLFILTENSLYNISNYIKDRPGRIRYHLDFGKLSSDIYEDYINCNPIDPKFKKDLDVLYFKAKEFSFDVLEAIVTEHRNFPTESLEELLTILNCKSLCKEKELKLVSVKQKGQEVPLTYAKMKVREPLSCIQRYPDLREISVDITSLEPNTPSEPQPVEDIYTFKFRPPMGNYHICWNDLEMTPEEYYCYKKDDVEITFRID